MGGWEGGWVGGDGGTAPRQNIITMASETRLISS